MSLKKVWKAKLVSFIIVSVASFLSLLFATVLSISIGSADYSFFEVFHFILSRLGLSNYDDPIATIIFELRFSRTIIAILVGAALGLSGTLIQASTKNPLASPSLLGLPQGALTLVSLLVLLYPTILFLRSYLVITAFLGAMMTFFLTLSLTEFMGGSGSDLILAGIAVSTAFHGTASILTFIVQTKFHIPFFTLLVGSFNICLKSDILFVLPILIISLIIALIYSKGFNALIYGDEYCAQLGYNPRLLRRIAIVLSSLLTGTSVAVSGIIGFVGLIIPHVARLIIGSDHRMIIPLSLTLGGLLTCLSDVLSRTLSVVSVGIPEIPVGAITSIFGAFSFAYLLVKRARW